MAGLTPAHLFIVLIIALVVIGPGKLPEVGSAVGKSIREFQKASSGVQEPVTGALGQPASQATGQQIQPVTQPAVTQAQVWSQPVVYAEPGYEAGYMPQAYPAPFYEASVAPEAQPIEAAPVPAVAIEKQPQPRAD